MKLIFVICLVAVIKLSAAVDRNVFKTCEQSSFCRRCRYQNASNFDVLSDTLYTDSTNVFVEVRNENNGHLFVLKLSALKVTDHLVVQNLLLLLNKFLFLFNIGQWLPF